MLTEESGLFFDDGQHVTSGQDEVFLTTVFDFGATVFGDEHLVVNSHVEGDDVAVLVAAARADGTHDGFLGLLLRGIGQEQATCSLGLSRVNCS